MFIKFIWNFLFISLFLSSVNATARANIFQENGFLGSDCGRVTGGGSDSTPPNTEKVLAEQQAKTDAAEEQRTGETDADKEFVACEYEPTQISILGNADCSNMFCYTWSICTDENGKNRKSYEILCSAHQSPDGSWTCPGAYDCTIDEGNEYLAAFVTRGGNNITLNSTCEGAGFLNRNTGELEPFPIPDNRNSPLIPNDY